MLSLRINTAIYFVANIAAAIIPFILLPILSRYLGPEGYGRVAMFLTLITMLSGVVGLNTHNGLATRWFDHDGFDHSDIDFSQYIAACVTILFLSALCSCTVIFGLENWLSKQLSIPVFWLYITVVVAGSSFIVQIRLVLWQVQEKPVKFGGMQFGQALFNGLLSYILVVVFLKDVEGRLWGQAVPVFLFGLLSLYLLYKDGLFRLSTRWCYIKDALAFGVPLIPHVLGSFLLLMADRMIVNAKLGTSEAGIYMVAVQIALGFNLINESFNKAYVPWLYARLKADDETQKIFIVKSAYLSFLLLLIAPLATIFLGKYVVAILAGPEFQAATPVLNWLILMQSFHGMYFFVTNYLFYERKTWVTSVITIISGSVGLVLTFYLVDVFGLVGAGISSAMGMLIQFLLTWIMAARVYPMPWFSLAIFQKYEAI